MTAFGEIRTFLARVRRRALTFAILRFALWSGVILVVAVIAAILLLGSGIGAVRLVRPLVGALLLAAALVLGGFTVLRTAWRTRGDRLLASAVERKIGGLLGAVRSAIELEGELPRLDAEPVFSPELVHAQAHATAERLRTVDVRARWPVLPSRASILSALAALVVAAVAALLLPGTFREGLAMALDADSRAPVVIGADGPLVGDLAIRLIYPAYADRAPNEIIASTGDISALRGTIVELRAVAVRPAAVAAIVLDDGTLLSLSIDAGDRAVRGELTIDRTVSYRFALGDDLDSLEAEGVLRHITVIDDLYPEVQLLDPSGTVTLSDRDELEIEARAHDDHGITRVEVVFEPPDGSDAVVREVAAMADPVAEWHSAAKIPLSELGLQPGDEVRYRVEVTDNDLISGPKRGTSAARILKIFSARDAHDDVLAMHEQIIGMLVRILGRRIERISHRGGRRAPPSPSAKPPGSPPPAPRASRAGRFASPAASGSSVGPERVLSLVEEKDRLDTAIGDVFPRTRAALDALRRMAALVREDPLSSSEIARKVSNASARLESLLRDEVDALRAAAADAGPHPGDKRLRVVIAKIRAFNDRAIAELEGTIVYLDDLLHRERLEDLLAAGDELARARDALRDLLKEYAETKDPALETRIVRELAALRRKMADLAARMVALRSSIPDEFINRDAIKPMAGSLDRIEKLIDEGRLDEALAELDEMAAAMESMLAELGGDASAWTEERFGARTSALGRLADEVEDLAAREAEIERRAAAIDEKRLARAKEAVRDALDKAARRAEGRLEKIEGALEKAGAAPGVSDATAEALSKAVGNLELLKRALAAGDIEGARDEASGLATDLGELAEGLANDADTIPKARAGEEPGLRSASKATRGASDAARDLAGDLDKLAPDPKKLLTPRERAELKSLGGKQADLDKRAAGVARKLRDVGPVGGEAGAERMGEVRDHMKRAEAHLRGGETRKGKVEAESAAEKLRRLAAGLREERGSGSRDMVGGTAGRSDEKVAIPKGDDYKAPKELREDILRAMKESAPEKYRAIVRRYYEELVK